MHQSPAAGTTYKDLAEEKARVEAAYHERMRTHGTQTNPHIPPHLSTPAAVAQAKQNLAASQQAQTPQKQAPPQVAPPKKTRRRTGKELLIAARQRREQQRWRNEHHPIPREDQWTCEFCEYEQIFGTPPVALIKQYEIKDRHARKQEAERRRLLEKAKMKGRKGKKGSKAAPKAAPAAHDRQAQTQQSASLNQSQSHSQGTQSEEYYEDEYDDDYPQDEPPPPSPVGPPVTQQGKPVTPDPGSAIRAVELPYASNGVGRS